ncbi:hypothetical protein BV22DRAFT_605296 [Leucogyrophana mollusca]|uniref:Uncharacterized protein n=1 Tax=Leucogyrophana mollusca TaxID=85980 RepID=A0ACB8BCV4_9AGAM|nr:hypothetical protein BV22DRAFT_605296 [Leucogyrophana mollusca]
MSAPAAVSVSSRLLNVLYVLRKPDWEKKLRDCKCPFAQHSRGKCGVASDAILAAAGRRRRRDGILLRWCIFGDKRGASRQHILFQRFVGAGTEIRRPFCLQLGLGLFAHRDHERFRTKIRQTNCSFGQAHECFPYHQMQPAQSNLTPDQGVQTWKTSLETLHAQGILLGSPAPPNAPSERIWVQDFLNSCQSGCMAYFIALRTLSQDSYDRMVCQDHNDANAQCSYDDIVQFMNQTQKFMDNSTPAQITPCLEPWKICKMWI